MQWVPLLSFPHWLSPHCRVLSTPVHTCTWHSVHTLKSTCTWTHTHTLTVYECTCPHTCKYTLAHVHTGEQTLTHSYCTVGPGSAPWSLLWKTTVAVYFGNTIQSHTHWDFGIQSFKWTYLKLDNLPSIYGFHTQPCGVVGATVPSSWVHKTGALTEARSCVALVRAHPCDGFQGVHSLTLGGWGLPGAFSRRIRLNCYSPALSDLLLALNWVRCLSRAALPCTRAPGSLLAPRTRSHRETGSPCLCLKAPVTALEEVNLALKVLHQTNY